MRVVDDAAGAFASADVAIDFSTPRADAARRCAPPRMRASRTQCGTTGFSAAERAELDAAAVRIPIVVGAELLGRGERARAPGRAARRGCSVPTSTPRSSSSHHAAKRDAPSGTALRLAEAIAPARGAGSRQGAWSRRARATIGARPPGAIGVQSLRGGDNPGEHSVFFLGRGERLELVHRAATRDHFARGALRAARWLRGRKPGLYTMEQVLGLR